MKLRAFAVLFVSVSAFAVEVPSDLRIYNSDATAVCASRCRAVIAFTT